MWWICVSDPMRHWTRSQHGPKGTLMLTSGKNLPLSSSFWAMESWRIRTVNRFEFSLRSRFNWNILAMCQTESENKKGVFALPDRQNIYMKTCTCCQNVGMWNLTSEHQVFADEVGDSFRFECCHSTHMAKKWCRLHESVHCVKFGIWLGYDDCGTAFLDRVVLPWKIEKRVLV